MEEIRYCPLKPGTRCAATLALAESSRCIACPLLEQCDQAMIYCKFHSAHRDDAPLLTVEAIA
jgi:hypothetical protein